mgnify:CR=1 FL=1
MDYAPSPNTEPTNPANMALKETVSPKVLAPVANANSSLG